MILRRNMVHERAYKGIHFGDLILTHAQICPNYTKTIELLCSPRILHSIHIGFKPWVWVVSWPHAPPSCLCFFKPNDTVDGCEILHQLGTTNKHFETITQTSRPQKQKPSQVAIAISIKRLPLNWHKTQKTLEKKTSRVSPRGDRPPTVKWLNSIHTRSLTPPRSRLWGPYHRSNKSPP